MMCQAVTYEGCPCSRPADLGYRWCWQHRRCKSIECVGGPLDGDLVVTGGWHRLTVCRLPSGGFVVYGPLVPRIMVEAERVVGWYHLDDTVVRWQPGGPFRAWRLEADPTRVLLRPIPEGQ